MRGSGAMAFGQLEFKFLPKVVHSFGQRKASKKFLMLFDSQFARPRGFQASLKAVKFFFQALDSIPIGEVSWQLLGA